MIVVNPFASFMQKIWFNTIVEEWEIPPVPFLASAAWYFYFPWNKQIIASQRPLKTAFWTSSTVTRISSTAFIGNFWPGWGSSFLGLTLSLEKVSFPTILFLSSDLTALRSKSAIFPFLSALHPSSVLFSSSCATYPTVSPSDAMRPFWNSSSRESKTLNSFNYRRWVSELFEKKRKSDVR